MADNVAVTAGTGTTIAADEITDGVLGTVKVQFVKIMDGTLDSTTKAPVTADGLTVKGKLWDGTNAVAVKAASTAPVATDPALVVALSPNGLNPNGQTTMANSEPVVIASNQSWPTGQSPKGFVAAFATLTRPANTTAYTALDSISNNATAGSVTALVSTTVSDTNDDPITLVDIVVTSTDTGLNGKKLRAYIFSSDPTASTGVVGGDNAVYSNKRAGYVGSFSGTLETGFSDGAVGRLTPSFADATMTSAGGVIVCKPGSASKSLWIQYQSVDGFTPSANSTTIDASIRGYQARLV